VFREIAYHRYLEAIPQDWSETVRFRLVYDGPLPPDGRGSALLKQQIRQKLHPQMRQLWNEHPALAKHVAMKPGPPYYRNVDHIALEYARGPYQFVPLVRLANHMACSLDILVLMRREPFQVFSGDERGDLDNRIKTLNRRTAHASTDLGDGRSRAI
jgi:hypothetical protein